MNRSKWFHAGVSIFLASSFVGCSGDKGEQGMAPAETPSATSSSNNPEAIQNIIKSSDAGTPEAKETAPTEPAKPEAVTPKDLGAGKPEAVTPKDL